MSTWRGLTRFTALTLRGGMRRLRVAGLPLVATVLVTQLAVFAIVLPVNQWLFREALRSVGLTGLDLGAPMRPEGVPFTLALIALIVLIAFWVMSLQFALFTVMLGSTRRRGTPGEQVRHLGAVLAKMLRPSSLPLLGYLFLLLPLTGFGFTSLLARGVAIPPFISGELSKSVVSAIVLIVVLFVLGSINVRFALTVPVFALTTATGGRASRLSWRLTRGAVTEWGLTAAGFAVFVTAVVSTVALFCLALLPTVLTDAIAPAASPAVAAVSLGIAQLLGLLLTGGVTAAFAAIFAQGLALRRQRLPADVRPLRAEVPATVPAVAAPTVAAPPVSAVAAAPAAAAGAAPAAGAPARRRVLLPAFLVTVSIAAAGVFSFAGWETLHRLHAAPDTLVLAHRGFSDGGVENTIGGLEAAAAAGADLVEMDVMETADHQFVAMHDANLGRLAGVNERVADLTLAELTSLTVRDLHGHTDRIPSFADYVRRAEELGMPLLIEIKLGGNDGPDHVERLIAELEDLGVLEHHIYHSLDPESVNRLKRLRPDLTVGYTMAFAAVDVPRTDADMLVVEQWTAGEEIQRAAEAAGLGFFTWTVNDTASMRDHLRRGTDGIITDSPDEVLRLRGEMEEHSGLAAVLFDALGRFVTLG